MRYGQGVISTQVKSKQRVADHGVVLTAESEVNVMPDLVLYAFCPLRPRDREARRALVIGSRGDRIGGSPDGHAI